MEWQGWKGVFRPHWRRSGCSALDGGEHGCCGDRNSSAVTGQTATALWGVSRGSEFGVQRELRRCHHGVEAVATQCLQPGLQEGDLWAEVEAGRSLGICLFWTCIWGRLPLDVPSTCTADDTESASGVKKSKNRASLIRKRSPCLLRCPISAVYWQTLALCSL